jgi:prolyl-tRNA editing enzyme YbaK/EbsC (Cys-tRNA(Pro) deacylase)
MAETRPGTAQLESYLRDRGVEFTVIEHGRTETAAAEARAAHLPAEQTAKTVVLRTPDGCFAVIPASERLDAHKASAALELGSHELRLATEQEMAADFPQYELGAIPPFGPRTPAELIDRRLLDYARVLCPDGTHDRSLLVDPEDIVSLTGARSCDLQHDAPAGTHTQVEQQSHTQRT